jgi:hypothetical protein
MNMGFDLSSAVAGYQGYKAADKYARDEAFLQAQRDYDRADMSERTAGAPSRAKTQGLADARTDASMGLLPQQTAVAQGALAVQGADQAFNEQRRPGLQDTTMMNDGTASTTARTAQTNANTASLGADASFKMAPNKIRTALINGVIDTNTARTHGIAAIGQALIGGDMAGATQMAHELADGTDIFPGLKGKTIGSITSDVGENGEKIVNILDGTGNSIGRVPFSAFQNAIRQTQAKPELKQVTAGNSLVSVDSRGVATEAYRAPVDPAKAYAGKTSLEKNTLFLMEHEGLSRTAAIAKARTGVHDDRYTAVNKILMKNPMGPYARETDPAKRAAMRKPIEDEYDLVYGEQKPNGAPAAAVPANVLKLFDTPGL